MIADELIELMNGSAFSTPFVAKRRIAPFNTPEDVNDLQVYVLMGTTQAELTSRDRFLRTLKPWVVVQKKITPDNDVAQLAEVDALLGLVEEIEECLEQNMPDGFSLQAFNEEQDREVYNIDEMRNAGVFTSILVLTYTESDG